MAYTRKFGQQQVAGGAPAAGLISTGGPQTAGAAGGGAPAKGGGYVNLQDYLRLNRGGAQQMADKVGDYVRGEGEGVTSALSQAQSDFDAQRLAGMGTDVTNGSEFAFPTETGGGVWVHGAPQPAPISKEQMDALKRQSEQTYAGPTGLGSVTDVGALATKAAKASDDAQMAGSFGGLAGSAGAPGLVGQVYGGHSTQGGANLDAFLAGSTGQLGGLSAQYGKLGEALDKAQAGATNAAVAAALETQRRADVARKRYRDEQARVRDEMTSHHPQHGDTFGGQPPGPLRRPYEFNPFGGRRGGG